MECENNLCIYCKKRRCILDSISLDAVGMCSDCVVINIDSVILEKAKADLLQKLHPNES